MNLKLVFTCIQQKTKQKKIPFEKKYFRMMRMCVESLLNTGFKSQDVICVVADPEHATRMSSQFGVETRLCENMPPSFLPAVRKNPQNYYFYKPVALYHALPKPPTPDTIMAFCDVDALFFGNPYNLLTSASTDVWVARGTRLPRRGVPKKYHKPNRNYEDLSQFLYMAGNGAISHLILKYNIPTPNEVLYTGMVAIKPQIYPTLIKTWYEMCEEVIQRKDLTRGDQEVFSAAVWHHGFSTTRSTKKFTRKILFQYGGIGKKGEMQSDFRKYCR